MILVSLNFAKNTLERQTNFNYIYYFFMLWAPNNFTIRIHIKTKPKSIFTVIYLDNDMQYHAIHAWMSPIAPT